MADADARKRATRTRLLDAAEHCLARSGYEGFTTRDVAREADLSNGILYHYFGSKDDLLTAVYERREADGFDQLLGRVPPGDDLGKGFLLQLLLELVADAGSGDDVMLRLRERATRDAEAAAVVARHNGFIVDGLTRFVELAATAGSLRVDVDAAAVVEVFSTFLDGLSSRRASQAIATSNDRLVRTFVDAMVFGTAVDDPALRAELRLVLDETRPAPEPDVRPEPDPPVKEPR